MHQFKAGCCLKGPSAIGERHMPVTGPAEGPGKACRAAPKEQTACAWARIFRDTGHPAGSHRFPSTRASEHARMRLHTLTPLGGGGGSSSSSSSRSSDRWCRCRELVTCVSVGRCRRDMERLSTICLAACTARAPQREEPQGWHTPQGQWLGRIAEWPAGSRHNAGPAGERVQGVGKRTHMWRSECRAFGCCAT